VVAAILHPLLAGRILFERDILTYWYEEVEVFAQTVAAGSWPVWDPWVCFGQPFLGNPETQVLYPFTWLNLIVAPAFVHTAFVLSHLVFSGLGMLLLARRFGVGTGGSFLAAAAWTASGPFLSFVSVWHHFAGASWIPWAILAAERCFAARAPRRAVVAWAAVIGVQALAGSADMAIMSGLLTAVLMAQRHLAGPGVSLRGKARLVAAAGAALLLGIGLSAALWLPTFDIARRSARWGLPSVAREYWSLHPLLLGQVGLPVFLVDLPIRPEWRGMLFEGREPFLESVYLGLATLGLVAAALVARRGNAEFLAALAVLATAAALGRYTFVYGVLVSTVPGVSFLRYPQKAMIVTALLTALLAGLGYDALSRPEVLSDRRRRAVLVGILAVLAAIGLAATLTALLGADTVGVRLFLPPEQAGAPPEDLLRPVATTLAPAAAASVALLLAALLAAAGRLAPKHLAAVAGVVVIADLVVAHQNVNPSAPRELVDFRSPVLGTLHPSLNVRALTYDYKAVPNSAERHLGRHVATLVEVQPRGWSYRASVALGLQSLLPAPMGARYGLFGSYDIDPRGLYAAPLDGVVRLFWSLDDRPADRLKMLQLGGVTHVVALHADGFEALTEIARHPSLFAEPIRVFRVPEPAPRSYAVSGMRAGSEPAVLLDPGFDFRTEVVLPDGPSRPPVPGFVGRSTITAFAPDRVEIQAELSHPGFVVMLDTADPGWRARVDGAPAPVLTANVVFRAVAVPAGRHRIEMRYWPRGLTLGLAVALLAVAIAAAALLWRRPDRSS
jgi:hypothetical protein